MCLRICKCVFIIFICCYCCAMSYWLSLKIYNEQINPYVAAHVEGSENEQEESKGSDNERGSFVKSNELHYSKLVDNYIQRYISLFLKISDLQDYEVLDQDESINVNLIVSISGEELSFLQKCSASKSPDSLQIYLSKLDNIFSNVVKKSQKKQISNKEQVIDIIVDQIRDFTKFILNDEMGLHSIIFFSTLLIMYKYSSRNSGRSAFYATLCAVNNIIIYEGFLSYKNKLVNLEVNLNTGPVASCNGWLSIFNSECWKNSQNEENVDEQISLLNSIIERYAFYIVKKPFNLFGKVVTNLSKDLTSEFHWMAGPMAHSFMGYSILIVAVVSVLLVFGIGMKLSFWGFSFHLGKPEKPGKSRRIRHRQHQAAITGK